ncbi:MAG: hypothetical protein PUE49_07470 [Eggerthellales bacterium]|nr:hypothetical protein [Eggerthellales bacterium]
MKFITHQDIVDLNIAPNQWYDWAEYVLQHKYEFVMPSKISLHFNDSSYYNTMPSIIPGADAMGTKMVNRYMGRTPSLESHLLLYRYSDGEFLSLMDANMITAMRTGASAVHAMQTFANPDFHEVGMMGFGNIGISVLEVFCDHFKDKDLKVKLLRYKDHAEKMVQRFGHYDNIDFQIVDTYEEIIRDSDVVVSSITFTDQLLGQDEWFKPGVLVLPVHLRGFQNCDLFFDKVYGDHEGQVSGFKYFDKFKSFAEVSEVLNGTKPGRESADERIIVYNVGMSIHDVYAARQIYDLSEGKGLELPQIGPSDRYWL